MQSLRTRDPEIIHAILALAMRFADNCFTHSLEDTDKRSRSLAEKAREVVMKRVSNGPVELSTLQCLCLLSLIDFTSMSTRPNHHNTLLTHRQMATKIERHSIAV